MKDYNEIQAAALELSCTERLRLCTVLSKSLAADRRKSVDERAREMFAAMLEAGFAINGPTRSRENCTTRAIIAHALAVEGYTEYAIASVLQRDHSTVHVMKRNVQNAITYQKQYPDVVAQYKSFTAKLYVNPACYGRA